MIHKISVENFGPFKDGFTVDFDSMSNGIWLIDGNDLDKGITSKNGIGKSMFYDAICYGIMGESIECEGIGKKLKDDLVFDNGEDDKKKPKMVVDIYVGDLRIIRTRNPNKVDVFIVKEDGTEERVTTTFSQDMIKSRLGVDWMSFKYLFRFGGGETGMGAFATSGIEFQRKVQDALVQADKFTKCLAVTREKIRDAKLGIENDVESISTFESMLKSTNYEIAETLEKIRKDAELKEKRLEEINAFLQENSHIDENYAAKMKEANELHVEISELNKKMADLKAQFDALKAKRSEKRKKESEVLAFISEIKDSLAGLEVEHSMNQRNTTKLKGDLEKAVHEKEENASVIASVTMYKDQLAGIEANIKQEEAAKLLCQKTIDVPMYEKPMDVKELQSRISRAENLIEELQSSKNELTDQIKRLNEIVADSNIAQNIFSIKKESMRHANMDLDGLVPGSTCNVCKNIITEEHIKEIQSDVNQKISDLQLEITDLEKRIQSGNEAKAEIGKLNEKISVIDLDIQRNQSSIKDFNNDLAISNTQRSKYELQVYEKDNAQKQLEIKMQNIGSYQKTYNEISEKLKRYDVDPSVFDTKLANIKLELESLAIKEKTIFESKCIKESNIRSSEEKTKELQAEINELSAEILKIKENAVQTEALLNEKKEKYKTCKEYFNSDPNSVIAILEQKKWLVEEMNNIKSNKSANDYNDFMDKRNKEKFNLEEKIANTNAHVDALNKLVPCLKVWENAFNNGIRPMVMSELLPVMNSEIVKWMSLLSGQQVGISFNEDMSLNIKDWTTGSPMKYAKLSSGMKMRVNLAVALSIRDAITMSSGCDMSIFVSDESADALDAAGMSGYAECLNEIARSRKVFVITHNPYMRAAVEPLSVGKINIIRQDKVSYVEVV